MIKGAFLNTPYADFPYPKGTYKRIMFDKRRKRFRISWKRLFPSKLLLSRVTIKPYILLRGRE